MNRRIYIWQKPDWPEFRYNAEALLSPLAELSKLHGELSGQMAQLGLNVRNSSSLQAITDELIYSSEIEGVMLNPQSVRSSIARHLGIDYDGVPAENHYIEGLVEVTLDAIRNCDEPLTAERLFRWHIALFPFGCSGMTAITTGNWRQGKEPMQVVSGALGKERVHYEAPPSEGIGKEMENLIEWCNNFEASPFLKSAIAHLWFVTIHPFDDGNGRIGRTIADMLLSIADTPNNRYYSISTEINRSKKEYYEILERTQKGDLDITEWVLWYFEAINKAIRSSLKSIERTLEKSRYWENFQDVKINERQRKVINRLWDGFEGKLTTSKWAKICRCSQDTALRDINDLIARNMLRKSPEGGRSASYLLAE